MEYGNEDFEGHDFLCLLYSPPTTWHPHIRFFPSIKCNKTLKLIYVDHVRRDQVDRDNKIRKEKNRTFSPLF